MSFGYLIYIKLTELYDLIYIIIVFNNKLTKLLKI